MLQNYPTVFEAGFFNSPLGVEARFASLTTREREILFELVKAANNKLVAKNLAISRFTVNQHLRSIYRKLGVNTKLESVMFFMSYAHCQAKKDSCKKPEDIRCKAREIDSCDVMVCYLASFCIEDEFCLLEDGYIHGESKNDPRYAGNSRSTGKF